MGSLRDHYFPNTEPLAANEMRIIALGTGRPFVRRAQANCSWHRSRLSRAEWTVTLYPLFVNVACAQTGFHSCGTRSQREERENGYQRRASGLP